MTGQETLVFSVKVPLTHRSKIGFQCGVTLLRLYSNGLERLFALCHYALILSLNDEEYWT
jgi:hypothetical protein